jgi:hypothetical protein
VKPLPAFDEDQFAGITAGLRPAPPKGSKADVGAAIERLSEYSVAVGKPEPLDPKWLRPPDLTKTDALIQHLDSKPIPASTVTGLGWGLPDLSKRR